jgi:DNA primase catalytic subunit
MAATTTGTPHHDGGMVSHQSGGDPGIEQYMTRRYPCDAVFAMASATTPGRFREFAFMCRRSGQQARGTPQQQQQHHEQGAATEEEQWVVRHLSFVSPHAMRESVRMRAPFRVEIGAAWTIEPRLTKAYQPATGRVATREITFDVDINDYDRGNKAGKLPARRCCTGATWCAACWPIVTIGCAAVDAALEEYGARGVGWFFSGNRGVHGWVMDGRVATAEPSEREALRWLVVPDTPEAVLASAASSDPLCSRVLDLLVSVEGLAVGRDGAVPAAEGVQRSSTEDNLWSSTDNAGRSPPASTSAASPSPTSPPPPPHTQSASTSSATSAAAIERRGPTQRKNLFLGWYAPRHPACAIAAALACASRRVPSTTGDYEDGARLLVAAMEAGAHRVDEVEESLAHLRLEGRADATAYDVRSDAAAAVLAALEAMNATLRAPSVVFPATFSTGAAIVAGAALTCLLPRIDDPVTVQPNHILRSPMCVHAATRRLGVLIDRRRLLDFFPDHSPRLLSSTMGGVEFDNEEAARRAFGEFRAWVETLVPSPSTTAAN